MAREHTNIWFSISIWGTSPLGASGHVVTASLKRQQFEYAPASTSVAASGLTIVWYNLIFDATILHFLWYYNTSLFVMNLIFILAMQGGFFWICSTIIYLHGVFALYNHRVIINHHGSIYIAFWKCMYKTIKQQNSPKPKFIFCLHLMLIHIQQCEMRAPNCTTFNFFIHW